MSKTPKPLDILIHPDLADAPEIQELAAKGHVVVIATEMGSCDFIDFDLVIGPTCWHMDKHLLKYLDVAIKAVRGIKYQRGKK